MNVKDLEVRLTCFMYLLMRDHLSVGAINGLVKEATKYDEYQFSDDLLVAKAENLIAKLKLGSES